MIIEVGSQREVREIRAQFRYCKYFKHKSGTWTSRVSKDLRDKGHDANNTFPCS